MIFVLLPLTGAVIGWVTNVLAIRLLFRPLQPFRLGPLTFQGLIPKRRGQIAYTVGDVVAEQLFSVDELAEQLDMPAIRRKMEWLVCIAVDRWCGEKIGMLPKSVRQTLSQRLSDLVTAEVVHQFPQMVELLITHMREQVDVRVIVERKINALPLLEVERLVLSVARSELKQIELLGAVLGFLIGLLQALLVFWLV
ncbi:MAG: DUF445 family protein [Dethiobacter sp.]|nr:DUF445 family protein [Dethiobacter sp.]MBS3983728.1 DUF445 family protein [Dethiobacter sp.]MCL4463483.1 DUF445 family protein [Bacillota bacterium]MCL5992750.1 DUF445 family protein [Bacillota bacterium]